MTYTFGICTASFRRTPTSTLTSHEIVRKFNQLFVRNTHIDTKRQISYLCEEPSLEDEPEFFTDDLLFLAVTTSRLPKLPLDLFRGVFCLFLLAFSVSVPPAPDF
jgi:hypothetical protein